MCGEETLSTSYEGTPGNQTDSEKALEPWRGGDMTTTTTRTDDETKEHRKPESIDDDECCPPHLQPGQRGLPAVVWPIHLRGEGSGPRRAEDIRHRRRPLDRL